MASKLDPRNSYGKETALRIKVCAIYHLMINSAKSVLEMNRKHTSCYGSNQNEIDIQNTIFH